MKAVASTCNASRHEVGAIRRSAASDEQYPAATLADLPPIAFSMVCDLAPSSVPVLQQALLCSRTMAQKACDMQALDPRRAARDASSKKSLQMLLEWVESRYFRYASLTSYDFQPILLKVFVGFVREYPSLLESFDAAISERIWRMLLLDGEKEACVVKLIRSIFENRTSLLSVVESPPPDCIAHAESVAAPSGRASAQQCKTDDKTPAASDAAINFSGAPTSKTIECPFQFRRFGIAWMQLVHAGANPADHEDEATTTRCINIVYKSADTWQQYPAAAAIITQVVDALGEKVLLDACEAMAADERSVHGLYPQKILSICSECFWLERLEHVAGELERAPWAHLRRSDTEEGCESDKLIAALVRVAIV